MIEPIKTKLTIEILKNMEINEVLYAEYSLSGSYGNHGDIMIYLITNDNYFCYIENIYTGNYVYNTAIEIIKKSGLFKLYRNRFGNFVYINTNIVLNIKDGYFTYTKNSQDYNIYSLNKLAFDHVVLRMKGLKCPEQTRRLMRINDSIEYKKEQKKILQEKLDNEIIVGKIYTEKEINEIIKTFDISQDYVSFRRDLINKGYLNRTNDSKSYWRNVEPYLRIEEIL
jgi:hypothetical protein